MAQAGYTPVILFHSTTASNQPTTANLAVGELALNVPDGKLYFNQSGTINVLASTTNAYANLSYTNSFIGAYGAGNGSTVTPTGNAFSTKSSASIQGTTSYSGTREFLINLGLTNNLGTISSTILSSAINSSVTTIPVASATGFPATGAILIDSEYISYTGISSNNFTGCTRGYLATTPASHSSGATVSQASWQQDKVTLYSGMDMNGANCGDGWSLNTVMNVNSGSRATANAFGYELDFNNNRGDKTTFGAGTLAGLAITGFGFKSTTAMYISSASITPIWQNGISFVNNSVVDSAIYSNMGSSFKINVADAQPLVFATTNAERMRISPAGGVSIGTVTDAGVGNLLVSGSASDSLGNLRNIPINSKTALYTLEATDNGRCISITTGGVTVPNSILSAGQTVAIFNNSASNQTITQGAGVTMYLGGTATTGNRTLSGRGLATILFIDASTAVITGAGVI